MLLLLEVVTVCFVSIAAGLALAHALEFPGKMRLDQRTYSIVQTIYYPGFTLGGISEPLAVIATFGMLIKDTGVFGLVLAAFITLVAMQAVFWFVTQPVNRYWLRNQPLQAVSAKFFSVRPDVQLDESENQAKDWIKMRNRWEYSHVARAVLSSVALICIVVAVASRPS